MRLTLILLVGLAFIAPSLSGQIVDGSFENGDGSGDWIEASTNFGTPICDANCGNCGGDCAPNTGSFYVWTGGASAIETASVSQSVVIPVSTDAKISMFVKIATPGPGLVADRLEISLDGNVLKTITSHDSAAYEVYTLVEVDVTASADGNAHALKIEGFQTTADICNILVDDVELTADTMVSALFEPAQPTISFFPNPASAALHVSFGSAYDDVVVLLRSMNGAVLSRSRFATAGGRTFTLNTSDLANGVYLVQVDSDHGMQTHRFTVTR